MLNCEGFSEGLCCEFFYFQIRVIYNFVLYFTNLHDYDLFKSDSIENVIISVFIGKCMAANVVRSSILTVFL